MGRAGRSGAALALCAAIGAGAGAAQGGRGGKVVRVERPRVIARVAVRLYPVVSPEGKLLAFGERPPAPKSELVLLDQNGYVGRAVLGRASPQEDACGLVWSHQIPYDLVDARPQSPNPVSYLSVAVAGVDIDAARARTVPEGGARLPCADQGCSVFLAVDRDGNETPDLVTSHRDCTGTAPPSPASRPGRPVQAHCVDTWLREGDRWSVVGQDVVYTCGNP